MEIVSFCLMGDEESYEFMSCVFLFEEIDRSLSCWVEKFVYCVKEDHWILLLWVGSGWKIEYERFRGYWLSSQN